MAGKDVTYTHAQWRIEAQAITGDLGDLSGALEHMRAGLVQRQAGVTQLREQARWAAMVSELSTDGNRILGTHDPRQTRVGEAQAAAGGLSEVAGDKRYNQ
jgi:hypothetical protein